MHAARVPKIAGAAALAVAAALFVTADSGTGSAPAGALTARYDNSEARTGGRSVAELQRRLRDDPDDATAWGRLGLAYLEAARTESDPALYPKAEGALKKSLAINPADNFAALAGMGALANARHDFASGLEWGERARRLNINSPEVHAVVGDALLELGRYDDAFETYQRLAELAPGLASFTRVSYALDLQGDIDGARRALDLAVGDALAPAERPSATTRWANWPGAPEIWARRSAATRPPWPPTRTWWRRRRASPGWRPRRVSPPTRSVAGTRW